MKDFPKVALGTWLMGGTKDPDRNSDDGADIKKILTAIKSGVTLVDTAQNYANGSAEELVGEAVRRLDYQEKSRVQILTKHSRLKLNSPEEIRSTIDDSFKRLKVDKIDYYLLHAPAHDDNATKLKYFFDVVDEFVSNGKIKNIGVSNFSIEMLEYARSVSQSPIKVNQVSLNIFNRKPIEAGLLEYCINNGIAFQAYRPLAASLDELESNETVAAISGKRAITKAQVALAYVLKKGADLTVSASSAKHWQEILAAADDNPLTQDDISMIEANIPSRPHSRTEYDDFIDMKLN